MVLNYYHFIDLNTKQKANNLDFRLFTESYNEMLKGFSWKIDFLSWIQGQLLKAIGSTLIKNPDYVKDEA